VDNFSGLRALSAYSAKHRVPRGAQDRLAQSLVRAETRQNLIRIPYFSKEKVDEPFRLGAR
jgi:hypothetical protein